MLCLKMLVTQHPFDRSSTGYGDDESFTYHLGTDQFQKDHFCLASNLVSNPEGLLRFRRTINFQKGPLEIPFPWE